MYEHTVDVARLVEAVLLQDPSSGGVEFGSFLLRAFEFGIEVPHTMS